MNITSLQSALRTRNMRAFLRVIREGESSQGDDAYRTLFGGGLFGDLSKHPNRTITANGYTSTAAGAYQFLSKTWNECRDVLNLRGFTPAEQDLAAVFLIQRRGALDDVLEGRIEDAIAKCGREWASLPGSPYGQPVMTLEKAMRTYRAWRENDPEVPAATPMPPAPEKRQEAPMPAPPRPDAEPYTSEPPAPPAPQPEKPKMAFPLALVAGLLPMVADLIPSVAKIFKPGSPVAERNVAAASVVLDTVVKATGAINAQDAIEKMKADPVVLAAATSEVNGLIELMEAGGGGIDGARKHDATVRAAGDMWHSPSFWMACGLLALVFWMMGNVMGLYGAPMDEKVRSAILNGAQGMILGGIVGYFFGQTTSRNRAPAS